jgi:hypothetical protein
MISIRAGVNERHELVASHRIHHFEDYLLGLVSKTPIALMLLFYKLYNIEHWIYIIALHVHICLNISYDIHVRFLSYIVFD